MSGGPTTPRDRTAGVADPWWDADDAPASAAMTMLPLSDDPVASERPFDLIGKLPALETLPLYGIWHFAVRAWQRALNVPSLRKLIAASTATLLISLLLGASVGVIVLNNVVLKRTGELNQLDQDRRRYRTENAQAAAKIAHLSAPPRIIFIAQKQLKMTPATTAIGYLYMSPEHARAAARYRAQQARDRRTAMRPVPLGIPSNKFNLLRKVPFVGTEPYDGKFL